MRIEFHERRCGIAARGHSSGILLFRNPNCRPACRGIAGAAPLPRTVRAPSFPLQANEARRSKGACPCKQRFLKMRLSARWCPISFLSATDCFRRARSGLLSRLARTHHMSMSGYPDSLSIYSWDVHTGACPAACFAPPLFDGAARFAAVPRHALSGARKAAFCRPNLRGAC